MRTAVVERDKNIFWDYNFPFKPQVKEKASTEMLVQNSVRITTAKQSLRAACSGQEQESPDMWTTLLTLFVNMIFFILFFFTPHQFFPSMFSFSCSDSLDFHVPWEVKA